MDFSKIVKRIADSKHVDIVNKILSIFMFPIGIFALKAPIAESILLSASFFLVTQIWLINYKTSEINTDTSTDKGKLATVSNKVETMETTANTINNNTNTINATVNTTNDNVNSLAKSINELEVITNYRKIVLADLAVAAEKLSEISGKDGHDFFYQWYKKEIAKLTKNLSNTNDDKFVRFMVYRLHDSSHQIYKTFDGDKNSFFYAPCTCKSINWWLNPYGDYFVKFIHANVTNKNIGQVRRIFIYENERELRSPLVKFAFVLHNNSVYKFKTIHKTKFDERFNAKNGTSGHESNFGIFGKNYVWEVTCDTDKDGPISGDFSMDTMKVKWYKEFFEALWNDLDDYEFKEDEIDNEIVLKCAQYTEQSITKLSKLYEEYTNRNRRRVD